MSDSASEELVGRSEAEEPKRLTRLQTVSCLSVLIILAIVNLVFTLKNSYDTQQVIGGPGGNALTHPEAGFLTGVRPGFQKTRLIMGVDVDYPPYAYTFKPHEWTDNTGYDDVQGVGPDMIKAMAAHCGFEVSVMRVHWSDCWNNGEIGQGLLQGWYHGCMTYTHAAGLRNQYIEFTNSWATPNKPSGLIVKLVNGKPTFSGNDDLNGRTIVDVTGWAPTAETLHFVKNQCTGKYFNKGFKVIQGDDLTLDDASKAKGANDRALLAVLEGKADAMWIYGDQAANYQCKEGEDAPEWNCDLWNGFGKTFAYVQSGMYGWMRNGTTIAMAKKGAGIAPFLNKCFESFQKTEQFYEVCKKDHGDPPHNQLQTCLENDYIKNDPSYAKPDVAHSPYMFPTSEQSAGCANGYCNCGGQ